MSEGERSGLEARWAEAAKISRRLLANRRWFEDSEVTYKRPIGERAARLLLAARNGEDMSEPVRALFRTPAPGHTNNLVPFMIADDFRNWVTEEEAIARPALAAFLDEQPVADRINALVGSFPSQRLRAPGAALGLSSMLLLGIDIAAYPAIKVSASRDAEKLLGWPPLNAASPGAEYQHHLDFLHHFADELRTRGVPVADMLEAQALLWILMRYGEPDCVAWRGGESATPDPATSSQPDDLSALAHQLLIDPLYLEQAVSALKDKHQLVFYGPPGTGKTFIARALAVHLAGAPDRVEKVQFHPNYGYEDFIQGFRPRATDDGRIGFVLHDGPLKRLADRARTDRDNTYVLLIDELNRGNLPRIFGELLFLLEYRDEAMSLMYADERFELPTNLWIIGTMNTADRSIGLIDAALRRRFHFMGLFPEEGPLDGFLRRWLSREAPDMEHVADLVDTLNARLRQDLGRHLQIGHSHFTRKGLDDVLLEQIWTLGVMPFIEDQLFGREEDVQHYTLDRIRRHIMSGPEVADADAASDGAPIEG